MFSFNELQLLCHLPYTFFLSVFAVGAALFSSPPTGQPLYP